jgi:hypothetical protein
MHIMGQSNYEWQMNIETYRSFTGKTRKFPANGPNLRPETLAQPQVAGV